MTDQDPEDVQDVEPSHDADQRKIADRMVEQAVSSLRATCSERNQSGEPKFLHERTLP